MSPATMEAKAQKCKEEIKGLEQIVKKDWKEVCLQEVSVAAEDLYNTFNEFQMNMAKLEKQKKDTYQMGLYKCAYGFLVIIENKVNVDFCTFLMNNSLQFRKLVEHFSKYCTKIERQHNITLNSERVLSSNG
ncbi:MAG: hypothetical protein WC412_08245 [Candidatus Omnitrophota bacterium]|jgi:hypothetical protein